MALDTTDIAPLIEEQVASLLVAPLEAESVVLSSGVRIFDSSEPLRIPTLLGTGSAAFVAENQLIPESNESFGEINLMPSSRKAIKSLTRFSNESLRQSTIGLDQVLKQRLVGDVSRVLDDALLSGDGTADTITGFINQPGVSTGTLNAADPDSLLDGLALAHASNVEPSKWFLSGADFFSLRKLKDADGHYLITSDVTAGARYSLFGIPVTVTNKLPTGTAVLADMSQVAVVRDIAPTVTILPERWAEFDQTGIRVVTRYDLGLLHPEGVVVLTAV